MLKALRQAVYNNIDEFHEIINEKNFKFYFENSFHDEDMLKTAPKGFPKDFEDIYFLKLKHYIVNYNLPADFFQKDFVKQLVAIFEVARPFNKFLNYTVDEVL